jgi:DNA-binding transcriptional MocR family regulator
VSVRATNWAWEIARERGFGGNTLLVLLRIADHADHDGVCWPGTDHIARYTGLSERRVADNLKRLEVMGLLERERRQRDNGRGRASDRLYLQIDQPDETSGESTATNRTPAARSTGRFRRDQPDVSDAPIDREPSKNRKGTRARTRANGSPPGSRRRVIA